jgi:O-acetylhomoserine (thiol)-lyase
MANPHMETLCLHAGQVVDETGSRGVPIHRTSSYLFRSTEHAAALFGLKEEGNIYTRLQNPTHEVLEKRMAALEAGEAAVATSSGTAAVFYSVVNVAAAGDEIVAARNLYGGTVTQFQDILPQFGIRTVFADPGDPDSFHGAVSERTRALFVETIGNPGLDVTDIPAIAEVAERHHLPLIVDNTFATPCLAKPLGLGAAVVVHSLTKWIGGHGTFLGGVLVDGGRFNWGDPKFTLYAEPDASYHGLKFGRDLGPLERVAFAVRARAVPLRNLGACISPDNAWYALQGLETLPLRMERHCANALAVARFLKGRPEVAWVRYPGLEDDPSHSVATRILAGGFGGVVVFGIRTGLEGGRRFIDALRLFSHLANVGDAKSLAVHPATTTHSQLSPEQQRACGITPDLVRLSVGLEHVEDILADLDRALEAA